MTDQDVRDLLERVAAEEPIPFFEGEPLARRARRRATRTTVIGALAVAATIATVLGGVHAIRSTPVPVDHPTPPPAPSGDLGIFAPFAGRIFYGNRAGIWGVDPTAPTDPAATVQLTSQEGEPLGWSSDGTRLLIMRGQHLFVLHADGSETRVTTGPMNVGDGAISPDGTRVVFEGGIYTPEGDEREALWAVDADGGRPEKLVESRMGIVRTPTFSPDGTRIAYVDDNSDVDHGVWLMNADGSDVHQIVPDPGAGHVSGLAWSPAGDRIALGFGSIYTFAPDGSDFTRVITDAESPSWSPDGSQLAYSVQCPEHWNGCGLGIADADGSHVRTFGYGAPGPWHPAPITSVQLPPGSAGVPPGPRRDGEFLVFARMGTGPGLDIAAQEPGTGAVRKIVETDGIVDCPDRSHCANFIPRAEWSSDGRWVAFQVSSAPNGPCRQTDGVWVQGPVGDPWQVTTPCRTTPGAKGIEELWAWSPEGARLAYARDDRLFVIDPTDGDRKLRVCCGGGETALAWAPDGTRIAFASEGEGISEVTADPEPGAGMWLLGVPFENVVRIDYSPDGTQIMVQDRGGDRAQVMNVEWQSSAGGRGYVGSDLHTLVKGADACCEAAWSPKGDRILYQLSSGNGSSTSGSEVWTVSPDGSNAIKIFDSNGCDMGAAGEALPVWAPNGTQVAYNACGTWVASNPDGTGEPQPIDKLVYRSWAGGGLSG
jgi:Tol biopolymer transport system component